MEQILDCQVCSSTGTIFKNQCGTCKGSGLIKTQETIEVDIPSGVQEGMAFVMGGKGHGLNSGTERDLIIKISEITHSIFNRVGSDLKMRLNLQYHQLVLGDKVDIETIEKGVIRIPIGEYSNIGQNLRIPFKGLRELNTDKRGDLIVTLDIDMPKVLDDGLKDVIVNLKNVYEKKQTEKL
jgi:molecular chaperone DnaJ